MLTGNLCYSKYYIELTLINKKKDTKNIGFSLFLTSQRMGKRSILIFIRLCVIRKFNATFADLNIKNI